MEHSDNPVRRASAMLAALIIVATGAAFAHLKQARERQLA